MKRFTTDIAEFMEIATIMGAIAMRAARKPAGQIRLRGARGRARGPGPRPSKFKA